MNKIDLRAAEFFFINGAKIRIEDDESIVRDLVRQIQAEPTGMKGIKSPFTGREYIVKGEFLMFAAIVDSEFTLENEDDIEDDGEEADGTVDNPWEK